MDNIIGIRIHEKRIEKKITQERFGELIGVSKWTVINWESGKRIPLATYLLKISSVLGVSAGYLLGEDGCYGQPPFDNNPLKDKDGTFIPVTVKTFEDMEYLYNHSLMKNSRDVTASGGVIFMKKHDLKNKIDPSQPPFAVVSEFSCAPWGILRGSCVVVNPAEAVGSMDVAFIRYHNKFAFKRVRFVQNSSVDLISAEGNVLNIPAEENDPLIFQIYGKAICAVSKIVHGV